MKQKAPDVPEFPLDALPPEIAREIATLAGCTGVPVAVAAFACLTAASGAVGNSIRVGTPTGSVPLGLQTAIISPVFAEGRRFLDFLLQPIIAFREDLQKRADQHGAAPDQPGLTTATSSMSPGTQRLFEEGARHDAAARAAHILCESLDSTSMATAIGGAFDRSILVTGLTNSKDGIDPSRVADTLRNIFLAFWDRLGVKQDARKVSVSILAMAEEPHLRRTVREAPVSLPWTLLDGRGGSFSALTPASELVLDHYRQRIGRLLTRRVRYPGARLVVPDQALSILHNLVAEAERLGREYGSAAAPFLEPVLTHFLRVCAIINLLHHPDAKQVEAGIPLEAARVIKWWLRNQVNVALQLGARVPQKVRKRPHGDVPADLSFLWKKIETLGRKNWNDIQRGLPKRTNGYWKSLLSTLVVKGQVESAKVGRSLFVQAAKEVPATSGGPGAASSTPPSPGNSKIGD